MFCAIAPSMTRPARIVAQMRRGFQPCIKAKNPWPKGGRATGRNRAPDGEHAVGKIPLDQLGFAEGGGSDVSGRAQPYDSSCPTRACVAILYRAGPSARYGGATAKDIGLHVRGSG